jgi:hypothetical protein
MTDRGEVIFPLVLILVVGAFIVGGFAAGYSWTVIGFPFGAAAVACVLAATQAVWAATGHVDPPPQTEDGEQLAPLTFDSLAWVFALAIFLYGLGLVAGPAVYLLAYLRAHGSSWALSLIIAAGSIVMTWGLFITFLKVPLPIEPLWMG